MKNPRVLFIVALVFAPMPAASVLAAEENQQTKSAAASQNYYEPSNFAVEVGNIGKTSKVENFADKQKTVSDTTRYSAARADLIQANNGTAQKIQMSPPALDHLKTKFEGPGFLPEVGHEGLDEKSNGQEDIFAMMLQMHGKSLAEKRGDRKQGMAGASAEIKLKADKLDQEKQKIDEMKEEAGEKYDAAMTAANNELVTGIVSSAATAQVGAAQFAGGAESGPDGAVHEDTLSHAGYTSSTPAVTPQVDPSHKEESHTHKPYDLDEGGEVVATAETAWEEKGSQLSKFQTDYKNAEDKASRLLGPRAPVNEARAISSLKTLVSSQAMFYQGDVEEDGTYDYGTTETPPSEDPATADSGKDEDDDSK